MKSLLLSIVFLTALSSWSNGQVVVGSNQTGRLATAPSASRNIAGGSSLLSGMMGAIAQTGPVIKTPNYSVSPYISYEILHGTGILRAPGAPETVTMHTISPGVALLAGTRASLDYTLSHVTYSEGDLDDATNHNIRIQTNQVYDQWKVDLAAYYTFGSVVLVETATQTQETAATGSGTFNYQMGRRSEFELQLNYNNRKTDEVAGFAGFIDSHWTLYGASGWFLTHVSSRLGLGVGLAVGYDDLRHGADMEHTTPQAQVTWRPLTRLTLSAEYGLERRRTRAANSSAQNSDRYSASVQYTPFQTTTFTATISQMIEPSYYPGQIVTNKSWDTTLQQRLLGKFYLLLGASNRKADYDFTSAFPGTPTERFDRYDVIKCGLSTMLLHRISAALNYQRSTNRSSEMLYSFTSNQISGRLGYRF